MQKFAFSSFLIATSLFPDIDTPNSSMGRKHHFISAISKHRGAFHSIWIPLFSLIFARVYPSLRGPLMGIVIGYTAHLAADMLTKEGVMPLAPFIKKKIKGPFKTGHFFETIISAAIVMFFLIQPMC